MKVSLLCAAFSLSFLCACANTNIPKSAAPATPQTFAAPAPYHPPQFEVPKGGFEAVLDQATVTCEDPTVCPANVGLLIFRTDETDSDGNVKKDQYFQCTASLIGKDIVLTNSHCIPPEVKNDSQTCGDRLGFVRAGHDDSHPRYSRCATLLTASSISSDFSKPDYALFRLEDTMTETPWLVTRQGFPDQSRVSMYAIDPIRCKDNECMEKQVRINGVLKRKQCLAVQNSLIAVEYTHDFSNLIALFGDDKNPCDVIGGNSGSPLFTRDGVILGVAAGGRENADTQQIVAGKDRHLALGTSLACLYLAGQGPVLPSGCPLVTTVKNNGLFALEPTRMAEAIGKQAEKLADQQPGFKFKVSFEKMPFKALDDEFMAGLFESGRKEIMRTLAILTPSCIKPRSMWNSVGLKSEKQGQKEILKATVPSGLIVLTAKTDDYLRPALTAQLVPLSADLFELNSLTDAQVSGHRHVISKGQETQSLDVAIPWCTPQDLKEKFTLETQ